MFPPDPADTTFDRVLVTIMVLLFWGFMISLLVRYLGRKRPGMQIWQPMMAGFAIRVLSIAAVSATGIATTLRGGDETTFMYDAHAVAASSFTSGLWVPFGNHHELYVVVFALQLKLGEFAVNTLRITDVAVAMLGTVLVAVSIYDLAGRRAARLGSWLLAIEPTSIFFSEVLHKEPFMMLAAGLTVFGCTKVWKKLSVGGLVLIAVGAFISLATRPYAGALLVAGAMFLVAHAAIRSLRESGRAVAILLAVVGVVAVATPIVLEETNAKNLHHLQESVSYTASTAGQQGNNLALENVSYNGRLSLITNLPQRVSDLLLKPFPWQLGDTSQRIGALGTLVAYTILILLFAFAWRLRGQVFDAAAPILYPLLGLTVAYALSVGNAGTGFRYRSQLVVLGIGALVVLRRRWQLQVAAAAARRAPVPRSGAARGVLAGGSA